MAVRLEQHVGRGVISGNEVRFEQWRVIEGDRMLGYLSFTPGSSVQFIIPKLDPLEMKRISNEALALAGWNEIGESRSVPEVTPEMMKKKDEEDYDDIDS